MDDGRGARAEATVPAGGIPLVLAPLLAPYRRHGQLSVRVERLPNGARLSKGQNNGDRTWSLRPDDLDDVLYQPPEGQDRAHTLAVRILSLDGDHGATLAVLDLPVSPNDAGPAAPTVTLAAKGGSAEVAGDAELRRLRDQLTELTARLAVREAELAEARQKLGQAQSTGPKQAADAEPAATRVLWEAELKERLAAAAAEAASTLATSRDAWQAEQGGRFAELEKRADEQIQLAQQRWQQDARAAMSQAEANWKTGEAARLAAAEAHWREESTRALAAVEARWREESTRALGDAEARVKRAETALAQARPEEQIQRARDAWQQEAKTALARAEEVWKANEAARSAAAEARWREESRRSLAEVQARLQQAEAALAQEAKAAPSPVPRAEDSSRLAAASSRREDAERALAETRLRAERAEAALAQAQGQSSGDAIEIHILHEELREVKAALALRESQLAAARPAAERQGESAEASQQRQLSDRLIAELKNDARAVANPPKRATGGSGRRLFGIAVLLLVVALGVMFYPDIEAAVLDIWQPNGPTPSSGAASSAGRTKAPLHRPSSEGSRLP